MTAARRLTPRYVTCSTALSEPHRQQLRRIIFANGYAGAARILGAGVVTLETLSGEGGKAVDATARRIAAKLDEVAMLDLAERVLP